MNASHAYDIRIQFILCRYISIQTCRDLRMHLHQRDEGSIKINHSDFFSVSASDSDSNSESGSDFLSQDAVYFVAIAQ